MMHTFYFIPARQKERQVEQHNTDRQYYRQLIKSSVKIQN